MQKQNSEAVQTTKSGRTWHKALRLMPEVLNLRKHNRSDINFVLRKWRIVKEKEVQAISRQIRFGIFLVEWSWLIGVFLILTGILAINIARKYSSNRTFNNSSIESQDKNSTGSNSFNNNPKTPSYTPTNDSIRIAALASVQDSYSPNFKNGKLTVKITNNSIPEDRLSIYPKGEIGISKNSVKFSGKEIGEFEGGKGGTPLVIKFNGNATKEKVQSLIRQITYRNTANQLDSGNRIVELKITDGDGGVSDPLTRNIRIIDEGLYQLSVPNKKQGKENTNIPINELNIESPENNKVNVVLSASHGIINIKEDVTGSLPNVSIRNNKTRQVTVTGTVSEINSIFTTSNAVTYKSDTGFKGQDELQVQVKEIEESSGKLLSYPPEAQEFLSVTKSIPINISLLNPPPNLVVPNSQFTNPNEKLLIGGITVNDPNNKNVTIKLQVRFGEISLNYDIKENLDEIEINHNKNQQITIRGGIPKINTILTKANAIVYKAKENNTGKDTMTVTVNDGEKTSRKNIEIVVNDAPILDIPEAVNVNGNILTKTDAINIITSWLQAKNKAFAPPFNYRILERYTTGNYYEDRKGTMRWLQQKEGAYSFGEPAVQSAGKNFRRQGERIVLDVQVTQKATLRIEGEIDSTQSVDTIYRYVFQLENGKWKISDSTKIGS